MIAERGPRVDQTSVETIKEIGTVIQEIVKQTGGAVWKLVDLAKTNPLMGAVVGLVLDDMLAHYGSHTETICIDCTAANQGANPEDYAKEILTGIALGPLAIITPYLSAAGGSDHAGHTYKQVKVPGIISGATNSQIGALILGAFTIDAAGSIITDITNISNVGGAKGDPASLVKPAPPNGSLTIAETIPAGFTYSSPSGSGGT